MEERMNIKKFVQVLKRRYKTILVAFLSLFILTALTATYVMKPTYEATGTILVGTLKKDEGGRGEINMLLASSVDLLKSPIVLNDVKKKVKFNGDLEESLSVQNNKDSQIINVVVRDSDPEIAKLLATTISDTAVKYMKESFSVDDIQVLNATGVEPERVGSLAINLGIGFIVSLFFGIGLAMLREDLDDSFKDSKEIEEILGLTILGNINLKQKRRNYSYLQEPSYESKVTKNRNRGEVRV